MAVITGAASGIGRAIAHKFAANGASVCLLDINRKHAETVADEITNAGGTASAYECDVSDRVSIGSTFDTIWQQGRIHILVNNAGVSHIGTVESTTELDFDRVFRVNVKGYFNCINAVIGKMKSAGGGVILNMASVAGSAGLADRFAYSASKGAVIAMTYSVARDYIGHNIRCNCMSPARVHTTFVDGYLTENYPGHEHDMFEKLAKTQPIGRMGEPEEVASLALFLCCDAASFITGVDYPLDGGFMNLHG
ncbi:MAG: short-chain dehydrogenase [Acidobacteria bacterium]|nr:MAG: short-chain dehydrogenase [Acidobacteriota bacterium]PYV71908.1 MAG: short-chain dehydrogenase [Acidobacteriota bacterium]PYV73999.1 MAG: short-chain dehydrogenase [Acidobacteriota bacterium]